MNENKKQRHITAAFIAVMMAVSVLAVIPSVQAPAPDEYYVYANFNSTNTDGVYTPGQGVGGYSVSTTEGYLYVATGVNCSVYKVTIPAGSDPNVHPDNPDATGPTIAPRTLTLIQQYDILTDMQTTVPGLWHIYQSISAFVVDDNYIYYGPSVGGIHCWVKNADGTFGAYQGRIVDVDLYAQTLAYDGNTFYAGAVSPDRHIYSFTPGVDTAWQFEFSYTALIPGVGWHHDGLECSGGYLWVSDMTSNAIAQYEWDGTNWIQKKIFTYTNPVDDDVEGMGFGPFGHFWATGWNRLYEVGGGKLQEVIEQPKLCPDEYRWGDYNWDPFPDTFVGRQEVHFVNSGTGDAYNVIARVTCVPINVVATDPDVTLDDIPAGGSAWSTDTFELRVDMTNPQDPNKGIVWRVEYDDSVGNHHVITNVPKFCGEPINCP